MEMTGRHLMRANDAWESWSVAHQGLSAIFAHVQIKCEYARFYPCIFAFFHLCLSVLFCFVLLCSSLCLCSPHLCVRFLFLVLYPVRLLSSSFRPCFVTPTFTQLFHTHAHIFVTHTTLSHTHLCHTQLCHTPSFTHNFVTHIFVTHNFVTLHLSHTTWSHTFLAHTHSFATHTHTHTRNFVTHNFVTHHLCHTALSHTFLSHTTWSHTSLSHTAFSHTTLSHTTLSHTHTHAHTIFHTQLCHTHLVSHNFVTHHLCHTTWSHTFLAHTHTELCHTHTHTRNFVTHNFVTHTHTHTIFHTQLCHTHIFVTQLGHTHLCHTQLCHTPSLRGWRGGPWRHRLCICVAGVALGDIHLRLRFVWQAWHLATHPRHFVWHACVTYGMVARCRAVASQAWHLATSTLHLRGKRVAWRDPPMFAWQAWRLWHWAASGGALQVARAPRHLAWQASHLATSTCTFRGRPGAWRHPPMFCVAGVALMALGCVWWCGWGALRHFAWQVWRLATSTCTLRGRSGTWRHSPTFCVAGVAHMALGAALCAAGVALGDIDLGLAWQAWHLATSTCTLRGKRGTWRHPPMFCVAGVTLMVIKAGWATEGL